MGRVELTQEGSISDRVPAVHPLEPGTQFFIDELAAAGEPPFGSQSVSDERLAFTRVQSGLGARPAADNMQVIHIATECYGFINACIYRPDQSAERVPALLYFHGGGWMLGDVQTHYRLLRELTHGVGAAVVFVEFDRAPEFVYPRAIEQAYAATRYVAEHASTLHIDPARIAVIGDGTGGNIAIAVTLLANERREPKIAAQVLFYPVVAADLTTDSYVAFESGPWLTRAAMKRFWDAYAPNPADRLKVTAAPLCARIDQLTGLPAALIITAEHDVVRDEGEAFARRLSEAGVRVTAVRFNCTIHDFVMLNALIDTPASRGAITQTIAFLKEALE